MSTRTLIGTLLLWSTLLAGVGASLRWYAEGHFLPEHKMELAVRAGDGCFVFLGDSRMDAATDLGSLHAALQRTDQDRCLVPLALGATDISGMALTARKYLQTGRRPRSVIIGEVGDSLLGDAAPLRPENMVGNNAIHLTWSRAGDVFNEAPGFPWSGIDAFDAGFRFLTQRMTPLGRYQSLISAKTQTLAGALTGVASAPRNRFGALGDMALLGGGLQDRAPGRLTWAMQEGPSARWGVWFSLLASLLREREIPFVVVELPTRRSYQTQVSDTPQAKAYQEWLLQALPHWGGALVDLSRQNWVRDDLFVDELHLGSRGATLVSTMLGEYLGRRAASRN